MQQNRTQKIFSFSDGVLVLDLLEIVGSDVLTLSLLDDDRLDGDYCLLVKYPDPVNTIPIMKQFLCLILWILFHHENLLNHRLNRLFVTE